jgi:sugar O-acyltransferase (sialic acid O-acetyltransferase NeuD family)
LSRKLLILGTRSLAEEIADLISEIPGYEATAFVENMDRDRGGKIIDGLPVLWVEDIAGMADTHSVVCGLATTQRRSYIERVKSMGFAFPTLIHPSSRISSKASLGEGCFVSPQTVVSTKTVIGSHVFLNRGVLVGHHSSIGDFVTVQPGANIAGLVTIGEASYIAMGAVVLDRVTVGQGCVVGAGAVVTKDVPDNTMVVGVPAKVVKTDIEAK